MKIITNTLTQDENKRSVQIEASCCDLKTETVDSAKKYSTLPAKESDRQTGHSSIIKIQVENCSQCVDSVKSSFFTTSGKRFEDGKSKDLHCKANLPRVNYNSIESMAETDCTKSSKSRCGSKASIVHCITKSKKCSNASSIDGMKTADSMRKYLWGGNKSSKSQAVKTLEKSKVQEGKNSMVKPLKYKKASSPVKKVSRSSLTIDAAKVTINLSKYSPCASRLAASSKILSNNSSTSLENSPRTVSSRSPLPVDVQIEETQKPPEKVTIQASLSLNIQQIQKSNSTPRSRSVGDSCVTSPTSEATTLSYSPTGTEILSLEEVGPQISVTDTSGNYMDVKDKLGCEFPDKAQKATLETKC
ncbi:uncharacterized protein LOC105697092 [Orussus abietinus]|uniref:uncharacterized protein LOC105697092 n=1 Tax=Orussus abietinus TaxID=222816 RepID=UPI000C715FB0|nr:uncharacterized protein LOC105697092 [Orussus abietinus]